MTVPATPEDAETVVGPRPLPPIATEAPAWNPHFLPENETLSALARDVTLRRAVWQFEFSFKPMRMLVIDQPAGESRRIWYLLYKIKNTGSYIRSIAEPDPFGNDQFRTASGVKTERFFPLFLLRAHEFDQVSPDRLVPGVMARIHAIEIKDPRVPLYDSVSITKVPIEPSSKTVDRGVWGVATWPDLDRRIDFFSVYIQGLSNAYRWEDGEDGQPRLTYKTLMLNFWRPGDAVFETEREFRYGLPSLQDDRERILRVYGLAEPLDYQWIYLP